VHANGMALAYRELGSGPPVLLLHGWPTSSYLWRDVMPKVAQANRVIALDLPGFGGSDKPTDAAYDFAFFESAIDAFLEALGVDQLALGVHDLGGPVGLHWAAGSPGRLTRLALLNTLVYPEFSEAVIAFITACSTPASRDWLTSPEGLEAAMRLGLADPSRLTAASLAAVQAPFAGEDARRALAAAGIGVELRGFQEIAAWLPTVEVPVRVVYGEQDQILPDIAETVARVQRDVPHAVVTALPDCGHFLQEEAGEQIGDLLAAFFAGTGP
jgi:pimeloyl-ACP methyl ester carboxylesterase